MKKFWDKFTDTLGKTIFHPQYFLKSLEFTAIKEAKKYAGNGTLVDIGCGRQPYKKDLLPYVKKYIGVDHPQVSKKYKANEKPDILADATKIPLANNFADMVMMISVLEHLPDPRLALKEAFRITKRKGVLVAVTIQNYRLHDEPFDFFRYTQFGLREILQKSGFKILKIKPLGNYTILTSQYFNIFILYKIKKMIGKKGISRLIAILILPLALIICFMSNLVALAFSKLLDKDKSGAFAIYNMAVVRKI